ncbi:hypothetical protein [Verrucomicrobium spinosum]|uniref:hypothetical protein n=1 Tax=Verrucomicrobium spinosum TaxID=2736 RepID=UPI001E454478|nr:hypothetical protein [Verrucomicrobium spinosum]
MGSFLVAAMRADLDGEAVTALSEWVSPPDYKGYYKGVLVLAGDEMEALFPVEVSEKRVWLQIIHRPTEGDFPIFSGFVECVVRKPAVHPDDAPPLVTAPNPFAVTDARYAAVQESLTAVVDITGDDDTGEIGKPGRPFLTMQAALSAIMAAEASNPSDVFVLRVKRLASYEPEVTVPEVDYRTIFLDLEPGYGATTGTLNLTITFVPGAAHSMTILLRGEMSNLYAKGISLTLVGQGGIVSGIEISDPSDEQNNPYAALSAYGDLQIQGSINAFGASGVPGKNVSLGGRVNFANNAVSISTNGSPMGSISVQDFARVCPMNGGLSVLPNLDSSILRAGVRDYRSINTYTLTSTPQQMGGYVELPSPGLWLLSGQAVVQLAGATFSSSRTISLRFRRVNNTEADVGNALEMPTQVASNQTRSLGSCALPVQLYQTIRSGDRISLFGGVSVSPSAGNLEVVGWSMLAFRVA